MFTYIPMSHIKEHWCLNKAIYLTTKSRTLASLQQFCGKMWVAFWLNTEIRFIIEIFNEDMVKNVNTMEKT